MTELRVIISTLDRLSALQSFQEVRKISDAHSSVCLDFGPLRRTEPLGMLLFAASMKEFREQVRSSRPDLRFRAIGHEGKHYQAHMGFFRMFGLNFGNMPNEVSGNERYEPIKFLDLKEIEQTAADEYLEVHEGIEQRSHDLAKLLVQDDLPDVVETLGYSLREIIRNSLEHARVDGVWYCAQYWPSRDLVELALLDQGIGITKSLGRNPHLALASDQEALRQALQPGISGVAYKGAPKRRTDAWQNSGFGLYMTSRLSEKNGEFFIGSGDAGLALSQGKESVSLFGFPGTAISIRFRPQKVAGLAGTLEELRKAAADRKESGSGSIPSTASMSSMMTSRDYGKK